MDWITNCSAKLRAAIGLMKVTGGFCEMSVTPLPASTDPDHRHTSKKKEAESENKKDSGYERQRECFGQLVYDSVCVPTLPEGCCGGGERTAAARYAGAPSTTSLAIYQYQQFSNSPALVAQCRGER